MANKLKGKIVAKLPKSQKKKMEKTLKRMNKTRKDDSLRLRTKIEQAIKKHSEEIAKLDAYTQELRAKLVPVKEMSGFLVSAYEVQRS